jgi:hypothetical protein
VLEQVALRQVDQVAVMGPRRVQPEYGLGIKTTFQNFSNNKMARHKKNNQNMALP